MPRHRRKGETGNWTAFLAESLEPIPAGSTVAIVMRNGRLRVRLATQADMDAMEKRTS